MVGVMASDGKAHGKKADSRKVQKLRKRQEERPKGNWDLANKKMLVVR